MTKKETNDGAGGFLLLLLLLLGLHVVKGIFSLSEPERPRCDEKVFVQISGDMIHPGVYGFCQPPDLADLLIQAGGLHRQTEKDLPFADILLHSGARVDIRSDGEGPHIFADEMSAFYKITLGIPVSLNREALEGLTAVPGIGPKIAGAIVHERAKRGGFQRMDEILSVQGVGPTLYRKIRAYLVL
jgi:competence protein ComEA